MIKGADYSIAGMFASQCGAPYQYNNTKNLICLGDILHTAGYKQVFMQGSDMKFEHMGDFYLSHGYNELYGKKKLPPIDDPKNHNYWDITDKDLFSYAYDKFLELNKNYLDKNQSFNLTIFISDTHDGTPSRGCPKYYGKFEENHFFQSYYCTDYLLEKFIPKVLQTKGSENLVIAVIGDHLQNFDIYASKLKKMNRRVLALIHTPDKKSVKIIHKTNHTDFAPTLLGAMGVNHNAIFLFGTNALKSKKNDYFEFESKQSSKNLFNKIINSYTWLESVGFEKHLKKKKKLQDIYFGSEAKVYYSEDDNILFVQTKKIFDYLNLRFETKDNQYFDGNISISKAYKIPENWYVWIFGNKFKGVDNLQITIHEIVPIDVKVISKTVNIISFYGDTLVFNFTNSDPNPNEKANIKLHFSEKYKGIKLYISDLYQNTKYPNRVKYFVHYHNKVLFEGDIGDKMGIKEIELPIIFKERDRNVTIELVAQKGIEKGWAWGKAARVKVRMESIK